MKQEVKVSAYCKVCLLPHDEEIHQATLAVREWHRWQVVKGFEDTSTAEPETPEVPEPTAA